MKELLVASWGEWGTPRYFKKWTMDNVGHDALVMGIGGCNIALNYDIVFGVKCEATEKFEMDYWVQKEEV